MPNVLLYGGCVIRDAYSVIQDDANLVRYVARQSLISATTPPVSGLPEPSLKSKFQNTMVSEDIRSTLLTRLRNTADTTDLIVMDCNIERLGIYDMGDGTYLTPSNELKTSRILESLPNQPRFIPIGSAEHTDLYQRAAKKLAQSLKEWGLIDRFLIIDAPWATHDSEGEPFDTYMHRPVTAVSADVSRLAGMLQDEGLHVITLPEEHQVGDANHKWLRGPYHFIQSASEWIAKQICKEI